MIKNNRSYSEIYNVHLKEEREFHVEKHSSYLIWLWSFLPQRISHWGLEDTHFIFQWALCLLKRCNKEHHTWKKDKLLLSGKHREEKQRVQDAWHCSWVFLPPGALSVSNTNTGLQVGPVLRFTVETQYENRTRICVALWQNHWQTFSYGTMKEKHYTFNIFTDTHKRRQDQVFGVNDAFERASKEKKLLMTDAWAFMRMKSNSFITDSVCVFVFDSKLEIFANIFWASEKSGWTLFFFNSVVINNYV